MPHNFIIHRQKTNKTRKLLAGLVLLPMVNARSNNSSLASWKQSDLLGPLPILNF